MPARSTTTPMINVRRTPLRASRPANSDVTPNAAPKPARHRADDIGDRPYPICASQGKREAKRRVRRPEHQNRQGTHKKRTIIEEVGVEQWLHPPSGLPA